MKSLLAVAAVSLSLIGSMGVASAQPYGGRDSGYGGRDSGYGGRDSGYGGRDSGYGDRDDRGRGRDFDSRDRGRGGRDSGYAERGGGFDESSYIRCNPDVRQALRNGQLTSALAHYQKFGRREGRRLSC